MTSLQAMIPLAERPAEPLPSPSDWSFELIERYHDAIRRVSANSV